MRKWLTLAWLLIPVLLVSYHFGPGQQAAAYRSSQDHLSGARQLEETGHWEEAIQEYDRAIATLPTDDETGRSARLAQIQARFRLGRLAETISSLAILADEVEREYGRKSPLTHDVRDLLGRVHFQAMVALRLESADEAVWKRHWELSRQNFRFLAEHTSGTRNAIDRKNLEAVIKSAELPVDSLPPPPAGGATTTAGLQTLKAPATVTAANGAASPVTVDARPRQNPPKTPIPVPDEFDLGS
jgi:hypothetical protein